MRKKILHLALGGWLNAVVNGLLGIYVARVLGPSDRGLLALAVGSIAVLAALFGFGTPQAVSYFIRNRAGAARRIRAYMDRSLLAGTLCSAALVGLGSSLFSRTFLDGRPLDGMMMALMVLAVASMAGTTMLQGAMVAIGEAKSTAFALTLGAVANAAATVALFQATPWRVHAALAGVVVGQAVTSILFRVRLGAALPAGEGDALPGREFLAYGLKSQVGALAGLFFKRLDLFFIGYFLSTAHVGFYAIGLSLRDFLLTFPRAATGLLGGEMADPRSRREKGFRLFRKGVLLNVAFTLAVSLGGLAALPLAVPLVYGEAFREAASPSIIVLFSTIPFSVAILAGVGLTSAGLPLVHSLGSLGAAALGALGIWILTGTYGLAGAAYATVVSATLLLAVNSALFYLKVVGPILAGSRSTP